MIDSGVACSHDAVSDAELRLASDEKWQEL